jgi:hypothetical protein
MGIQYRPICEVMAKLAESALVIADDYFTNQGTGIEWVGSGSDKRTRRHVLVARNQVGRDQQRQLSKIFNDLERLSGSTSFAGQLRELIRGCRATYLEGTPYRELVHNHHAEFRELAGEIMHIAAAMPDTFTDEILLVSDTNSLLDSPPPAVWTFPAFDRFTLVVPTMVVGELEEIRESTQDSEVREKCVTWLDRLNECRADVKLTVPSANGNASLVVWPLEPVFDESVAWLDPGSIADRFIAGIVGLIRQHPRCIVALVTHDATLQRIADDTRIDTLSPHVTTPATRPEASPWP